MKRLLLPLVIVAGLLAPPAAHAGATEDRIVAQLRDEGFTRIEISRTLLGRSRIVATGPEYEREIVLNPNTGVILRDFWIARRPGSGGSDGGGGIVAGPGMQDGDRSGSNSGSSRKEDRDRDRERSDDRTRSDNSGSGSGSSGSGGDDDDDNDDDDDDDDDDDR